MISRENSLNFGIDFWTHSSVAKIYIELEKLFELEDLDFFYKQIELNPKLKEYFIYYSRFFSEGSLLEKFINRSDTPILLIFEILYAGFSINKISMNPVEYFTFWTEKLSSDQSLRLLSNTSNYKSHPIFIACLLSNLDAKTWEDFFSTLVSEESEIYKFLKLFEDFTKSERERMFALNQTLCKYFNLLITLISTSKEDPFLISLKQSIDKTLKWEEYAKGLKATFLIENETNLPPNLRNSYRLSCIIHDTINIQQEEKSVFLRYLYQNSVIVDEEELLLIENFLAMKQNNSESIFTF